MARSGRRLARSRGRQRGRTRFIAVLAMLMSVIAALVMIAQWIPDFIVSLRQH